MLYYLLFVLLLIASGFSYHIVKSNALIPYAEEEEKISIKEDSIHTRRSTFFYNPMRRFPTDDGGFGFGK